MRRFPFFALLFAVAFFPLLTPSAKGTPHKLKALQVRHFTLNPGVDLSPDEVGYMYEGMLGELRRSMLAEHVLDDASTMLKEIAADSIVMECTLTLVEQGNFPLHPTRAHAEFKLYRASDHQLITTTTWLGDNLGRAAKHGKDWRLGGFEAAEWLGTTIKKLQTLSSFPPSGQASTEDQAGGPTTNALATPKAPSVPGVLTNDSIIEMVTAKLPDEIVITKIQISPNNFDLSTPALANLNQKGVSVAVMKAMLMAPKTPANAVPPTNKGKQGSKAPHP